MALSTRPVVTLRKLLFCTVSALCVCLAAAPRAHADILDTVQILRAGGCGGLLPAAERLRHEPSLDRAAARWAEGATPGLAAERSGYSAKATAALHVSGVDAAILRAIRQSNCRLVTDPALEDIGIYRRGLDTWLLLASAYVVPPPSGAPQLARRALDLVNDIRAHGARCGDRSFAPAPPVRLSATLTRVASGHAVDMAEHDYFEHEDLAGHSPAQRVKAAGYREMLVGENIAYGPETADEVIKGWLDSPGHCANIMDPRFGEMGVAFAAGERARRGLYWVQLLAAPRA